MRDEEAPSAGYVGRLWDGILRARRGDTRFLIWVTFLVTFVWIRVTTRFFPPAPTVGAPGFVEVGGKTIFFGYHPHHIAWGILWLAVAGWIALHHRRPWWTRTAAVLYGLGLGLIVDEVSLVVRGINPGNDLVEVLVLVLMIGALLMSTIYAPSFWRSVQGSLRRLPLQVRHAWQKLRGRLESGSNRHGKPPTQ